jgi:hypothetical protein
MNRKWLCLIGLALLMIGLRVAQSHKSIGIFITLAGALTVVATSSEHEGKS